MCVWIYLNKNTFPKILLLWISTEEPKVSAGKTHVNNIKRQDRKSIWLRKLIERKKVLFNIDRKRIAYIYWNLQKFQISFFIRIQFQDNTIILSQSIQLVIVDINLQNILRATGIRQKSHLLQFYVHSRLAK